MRYSCLLISIFVFIWLSSVSFALTLTVDDIPSGEGMNYYHTLNCCLFDFAMAEHTENSWWSAHSGAKVFVADQSERIPTLLMLAFKHDGEPIGVNRVGAYFSTQSGVMLKLEGFTSGQDTPVTSVDIGAVGEAWNNHYVEITSENQNINKVIITPISSSDALFNFCVDDIVVEPTPIPQQ